MSAERLPSNTKVTVISCCPLQTRLQNVKHQFDKLANAEQLLVGSGVLLTEEHLLETYYPLILLQNRNSHNAVIILYHSFMWIVAQDQDQLLQKLT